MSTTEGIMTHPGVRPEKTGSHGHEALVASSSGHGEHDHPTPRERLFALLELERGSIALILVYTAAIGVVSLAAPLGVQALVNTLAFGGLRQPLVVLALLVFAALAFASVLRALLWTVSERLQERIFARVSLEIARRLPHFQMTSRRGSDAPELVNRFFDVVTLQKGAAALLLEGVNLSLQIIVGSIVLAFYHPMLFVFSAVLVLLMGLVLFGLSRRGVETAIEESKVKYELAAWFEEVARHPTAFRSVEGESFAVKRALGLTEDYLAARRRHFRVLFRQGASFFGLQAFAISALLAVGGLLVLEGELMIGQLIAAEIIVASVMDALSKFTKYLEGHYDMVAALDKVGHLIDHPIENVGGERVSEASSAQRPLLALEGVCFTAGGGRQILSDVTFDVRPGEVVSVLGANGSGKSTLLELLWGLMPPSSGRIELAGIPMRGLDLRYLREDVTLVRPSELFKGTVLENVRVGRQGISLESVRDALEAVGLWDKLNRLPEGLDTSVATAGFSAGESQRLLLARAIVGRPKVILVDGILDGLDAPSVEAIVHGVLRADAPWAVLLTTHDAEIAKLASKTFTLEQGVLAVRRDRPLKA